MSRTIRCKHYEDESNTTWNRQGKKLAGFYTEFDFCDEFGCNCWFRIYREPTKLEFFKAWYRNHGESRSSTTRSPNKYHRLYRMKQNRSINKQELHRFISNEDYEPLCEDEPRSCMWDWD